MATVDQNLTYTYISTIANNILGINISEKRSPSNPYRGRETPARLGAIGRRTLLTILFIDEIIGMMKPCFASREQIATVVIANDDPISMITEKITAWTKAQREVSQKMGSF